MYKILTKTDKNDKKWSFLRAANGKEFETTNIQKAEEKINEIINGIPLGFIRLVDEIGINVEFDTQKTIVPCEAIVYENTAVTFSITARPQAGYEPFVSVDVDADKFSAIKTYFESLGLTDVVFSPGVGIVASGNGAPIVAQFTVPEGLFIYYNQTDGSVNNINETVYFNVS